MSLTDREKKLLAEMEAALASDDPRLQSTLGSAQGSARAQLRSPSLITSFIALIAGLAILLTGLISQMALIGVAGFILALVGLVAAIDRIGKKGLSLGSPSSKGRNAPRTSFNQRLQDRWDRRDLT